MLFSHSHSSSVTPLKTAVCVFPCDLFSSPLSCSSSQKVKERHRKYTTILYLFFRVDVLCLVDDSTTSLSNFADNLPVPDLKTGTNTAWQQCSWNIREIMKQCFNDYFTLTQESSSYSHTILKALYSCTILYSRHAAEAVTRPQSWWGHHSGSGSQGKNLECVHGAGDHSPTHEGHHGIFNVHRVMPADGTPSPTSIRGTAHTSMIHPPCQIPGRQFIAGSTAGDSIPGRELRGEMHTPRQCCLSHINYSNKSHWN